MLADIRILDANGSRTAAFLLPAILCRRGDGGNGSGFGGGFRLHQAREGVAEGLSGLGEHDTVLRAFWTSERGLHGGEIEGEQLGGLGLRSLVVMEHALLACVGPDESDLIVGAFG